MEFTKNVDQELVKMALDSYNNNIPDKYSQKEIQNTLRNAMNELAGGDVVLTPRGMREGKYNELFALIETIVTAVNMEGLQGDEFFTRFVEYRNVSLGDAPVFRVEKPSWFYVSETSDGNQTLDRQRMELGQEIMVKTTYRFIKIYEEYTRMAAGRVDFNRFVSIVAESFTKDDLNRILTGFMTMMNNELVAPYTVTGTPTEDAMLDLVDHVEAANGAPAIILGTRAALRKLPNMTAASIPNINPSRSALEDIYNMGYFGQFNGTPMVRIMQRHAIGTTDFLMPNDRLYVIAGDSQFVKMVQEGPVDMIMGQPWLQNSDISQEFLMRKKSGIALVMSREVGQFIMT